MKPQASSFYSLPPTKKSAGKVINYLLNLITLLNLIFKSESKAFPSDGKIYSIRAGEKNENMFFMLFLEARSKINLLGACRG